MGYFESDDGDAFKPLLELRSEGYWTSRRGGATYRKAVLCSLPEAGRPPVSSTTGTSSADIVGAMNDWLREALAVDANGTKKDPPVLAPHWWKPFFDARNAFSRAVSLGRYPPPLAESNYSSWRAAASQPPQATSRPLPVFYPFSGADLLSAMAMLPAAPSYTLTSGLPVGTPDCFLSAACRAVATRHGRLYFQSLLTHSTGWTETQRMQAWMDTVQRAESKVGEPSSSGSHDASTPTAAPMVATGVLPVLLLSLHLAGHSVVHAERTTAHAVSLVCEGGTRVTYVPRALGPSLWPYFAAGDGKEDGRPSRTNGALRGMPALARPSPSTASLTLASPCAAALQARQSSTKSWHDNLKLVECLEQHEPGSLGDSLELQLDWLDRYVLDAQPAVAADTKEAAAARYAILIKAAGNARDLINSPLMSSWLLQHSMALVHDETGIVPSFYSGQGDHAARDEHSSGHLHSGGLHTPWLVRTFGNYSRLRSGSYHNLHIDLACPGRCRGPNASQIEGQLLRAFTGEPLPFVFGYGRWKAEEGGCLLAAWRMPRGAPTNDGSHFARRGHTVTDGGRRTQQSYKFIPRLEAHSAWGVDRYRPRSLDEVFGAIFESWNLLDGIMRKFSLSPFQTGYVREAQVRKMVELARATASTRHDGKVHYCEIGLNGGHSAVAMLLSVPNLTAHVFDTLEYRYSASVSTLLRLRFGQRFDLHPGSSREVLPAWVSKIHSKAHSKEVASKAHSKAHSKEAASKVLSSKAPACDLVLVDGDHTMRGSRLDLEDLRLASAPDAAVMVDDVVPACHPASAASPSSRQGAQRANWSADEAAYCEQLARDASTQMGSKRAWSPILGPGLAVRSLEEAGTLEVLERHGPFRMGSPQNPCLRTPKGPWCSPLFDWGFVVARYREWGGTERAQALLAIRRALAKKRAKRGDRSGSEAHLQELPGPICTSVSCLHVAEQIAHRTGAWADGALIHQPNRLKAPQRPSAARPIRGPSILL